MSTASTHSPCICAAGYSGTLCQTDIDECASGPCENGGNCTDLVNRFVCTCVPGFSGVMCQTQIDDCTSNPCFSFSMSETHNVTNSDTRCYHIDGSPVCNPPLQLIAGTTTCFHLDLTVDNAIRLQSDGEFHGILYVGDSVSTPLASGLACLTIPRPIIRQCCGIGVTLTLPCLAISPCFHRRSASM